MTLAYIGLGSNLDDPAARIAQAIAGLAALSECRLIRTSSLYRSAAWGYTEQPAFINAVAELETTLAPPALLDALLALERAQGRERGGQRWGPRRIDLDLLIHGDHESQTAGLELPHPRIAERAFVLLPLAELSPNLRVAGMGTLTDLLDAIDASDCVRLGSPAC